MRWQQGGEEYPLVNAVWRTMQPQIETSLTLMLDTSEFRDPVSGIKTGIGSSAALTVALVAALNELSTAPHDFRAVAAAAHRDFQQGKGSGVDIACSVRGGLIQYHMEDRRTDVLDWPEGLHYALLWSGVPVDTGSQLSRFMELPAERSRDQLVEAAARIAKTWRGGDAAALVEGYPDYCEALARFSSEHELGIYGSGHDEVAAAAGKQNLVYKPCGAGGGDVGIVLGTDASAVEAFAADSIEFGFQRLGITLGATGARME
jgi:phosphomevalonate kinase